MRPCKEESVDFDTTENLFIEDDNLDALKLLQETYLGKVKMIYIDPPYNTGKDFVYKDNFKDNIKRTDIGRADQQLDQVQVDQEVLAEVAARIEAVLFEQRHQIGTRLPNGVFHFYPSTISFCT